MLMQSASIPQVTMTVNAKMVSPVTDLNALISMNVNWETTLAMPMQTVSTHQVTMTVNVKMVLLEMD